MRLNLPDQLKRAPAPRRANFAGYVADLRKSPERDDVVVYFDLDRTLISGYSITALALEALWSGYLSPRQVLTHAGIFLGYGLGRVDYHDLLTSTVQALIGLPEEEMIELGQNAFDNRLATLIFEEARILIDVHKEKGHEVVMMTSATRYQAEPVAHDLGIDNLCCTELEIVAGRLSGIAQLCYGESKRIAAVRYAFDRQVALDNAFFYSDSCEDLPLLEAVGRPVAANAKSTLAKVAEAKGWTQLAFVTQGESRPIAA